MRVLAGAALLCAIGAVLALRLEPSAATDTLVGRGSTTFKATERYRERFGDHAIVILVKGDLPRIVMTSNLGRLIGLEGCIGGNKPADRPAPGGAGSPCDRFARQKPVQVVYGPGTFINAAVGEIQDQLAVRVRDAEGRAQRAARAAREVAKGRGRSKAEQAKLAAGARQLVEQEFTAELLKLSLRYGLGTKLPRVDDPDFVANLVFDASRGATTPKARFAYLFPNERSAVIQVRLKPGLSDARRTEAIGLVREAVRMKEWRPQDGVSYTVTGAPVLAEDLTDSLAASTAGLLLVGVLVMACTLAVVFRSRLRLLPLGIALAAAAMAFGLMRLAGAPLTMASIAALPVLLGLGVDYAIQYQARVEEAEADADVAAAATRATRLAVPTIATACLATGVGFLVLLLSPIPMVRGFGVLLVAGIVLAFVLALSAGTAALVAAARERRRGPLARSARGAQELLGEGAARAWAAVSAFGAGRGRKRIARTVLVVAGAAALGIGLGWWGTAAALVAAALALAAFETGRAQRLGAGALREALRRPVRVLAVGFTLALAGWVVDSQTEVVSDINQLVPQDLPALRDLNDLQRATDVAGEVDVVVEGADLTQPAVVAWMRDYQSDLLEAYGWSSKRGCGRAELCPALSLPDLFRDPEATRRREDIRSLLDAVPPYFSQAVITDDRRTANLAFGIKLVPLARQQRIIDDMRRRLARGRPAGVRAELAGLPVLAAEANAQLSSAPRRLGTLAAGLLAVGLALLLVYRRAERAWVPLVPIALATGWSALVLFALGVPLNPLSATLGALVIAISTEFSVLLCGRFREERAAGHDVPVAIRRTYASTGAAVLASGVTAIAGFAVLGFSDVQMLKDFGRVTVVDLSVSLLGVLAVLPAVLVLAERRAGRRAAAAPEAPRPARAEPVAAG
jgi:hydrophobe/amphiphile efflux-3 (HAE3) family protein